MDYLVKDLTNKKYTDVELTLIDPSREITIHAHKIILGSVSSYFATTVATATVTTTVPSQNQTKYMIRVDNASVAHDTILLFYGLMVNSSDLPSWKYHLEILKCQDYFCVGLDRSLLHCVEIPEEGFDSLLELIIKFDLINDMDMKLMRTVRRNLPMSYDLDNFSIEFVKKLSSVKNDLIISGTDGISKFESWNAATGQLLDYDKLNEISPRLFPTNLVTTTQNNTIKIWNSVTGKLLRTLDGYSEDIIFSAMSSNNLQIVSSYVGDILAIVNVETGQLVRALSDSFVLCAVFSLDNSKIISGTRDNIQIWDVETGQLLKTLHTRKTRIIVPSFDPEIIASCSKSHIKIWSIVSPKLFIIDNVGDVISMAFSPNNTKLASNDRTNVNIWDLSTRKLLHKLVGDKYHDVLCVTFSPDGLTVASSNDNVVNIWDVANGQLLNRLEGNICYVKIMFSELRDRVSDKIDEYILNNYSE